MKPKDKMFLDSLVLDHLEKCNMQDTAACFRAEQTFRDVKDDSRRAVRAFDTADSEAFKEFRNELPDLLYFRIRVYFALCNEKEVKSLKLFFESERAKRVVARHPETAAYLSLPFLVEFPPPQAQFKILKSQKNELRRQIEVALKPSNSLKVKKSALQRYVETRDRLRRCALESHQVCTGLAALCSNVSSSNTQSNKERIMFYKKQLARLGAGLCSTATTTRTIEDGNEFEKKILFGVDTLNDMSRSLRHRWDILSILRERLSSASPRRYRTHTLNQILAFDTRTRTTTTTTTCLDWLLKCCVQEEKDETIRETACHVLDLIASHSSGRQYLSKIIERVLKALNSCSSSNRVVETMLISTLQRCSRSRDVCVKLVKMDCWNTCRRMLRHNISCNSIEARRSVSYVLVLMLHMLVCEPSLLVLLENNKKNNNNNDLIDDILHVLMSNKMEISVRLNAASVMYMLLREVHIRVSSRDRVSQKLSCTINHVSKALQYRIKCILKRLQSEDKVDMSPNWIEDKTKGWDAPDIYFVRVRTDFDEKEEDHHVVETKIPTIAPKSFIPSSIETAAEAFERRFSNHVRRDHSEEETKKKTDTFNEKIIETKTQQQQQQQQEPRTFMDETSKFEFQKRALRAFKNTCRAASLNRKEMSQDHNNNNEEEEEERRELYVTNVEAQQLFDHTNACEVMSQLASWGNDEGLIDEAEWIGFFVYLTDSIGWERTYEILREIELCLEWDSGLKFEEGEDEDDLLLSFVEETSMLKKEEIENEKEDSQQEEKEWQECVDETNGVTYYYHTKTRRSTWTNPKNHEAARKIQSIVRRNLVCKEERERDRAAIRIQRVFRSVFRDRILIESTKKIQGLVRGHQLRKQLKEQQMQKQNDLEAQQQKQREEQQQKQHEETASRKIQATWRGRAARVEMSNRIQAATQIQSKWRCHAVQFETLNQIEAAKNIQSKWRGHTARSAIKQKNYCATRLQSWIRVRRCRRQFLAAKKIAEILYWNFRALQYRKWYMAQTYFALKLQSIYRSWHSREQMWTQSRSSGHTNMMALLRKHHSFKMKEKDKTSWDVVIPPGSMGVRLKRSERQGGKGTYVSGYNDKDKHSPVAVVGVRVGSHITKIDGVDVSKMPHYKIIKILKRKAKEVKTVTFTFLEEEE